MRYALIRAGVVENVIVLDQSSDYQPEAGFTLVPSENAGPGWTYDSGSFSPPAPQPEPVPSSITPLQARKALRQAGLKPAVDAYIATLSEEEQEEWEYAIEVQRTNPTLNTGWSLLGKSQAELDDLFRLGATL